MSPPDAAYADSNFDLAAESVPGRGLVAISPLSAETSENEFLKFESARPSAPNVCR